MAFLDKTGLSRLWTNILVLVDTKVPTSRKVNDKSLLTDITLSAADVGAATSSHTHDDCYYTETEIDSKLSGKANTSHGNHVPTTQEANNAIFLRNDNTWATVTPANIGAASSSHTHTLSQISDITATATELNYMDGVTSNVQTQLDGKAASGHTHTITASASDDDIVVLTGTNGTNGVTYSASHANSGVTAGTYKSVTVNAKGHVTGGTNPTTLAGYGITDAYTKTDMDGALAGKSNTGHTHSISNVTNLQNTLNSKVDLSSNQTVGGNKVFTGTTSTMVLHTYNPLYINNGSDNSKNTSLYTSDSNTFAITSSANNMTFNGENVAMMSDIENVELITISDIDAICGGSIVAASEVTY